MARSISPTSGDPPETWHCQNCGFPSPWWNTADNFPLCVPCSQEERREIALTRFEEAREHEEETKVRCWVEVCEMEGDYATVMGVVVTCSKCGNQTESYGTSANSVFRCLALMRRHCPLPEDNWYIEIEEEE